MEYILHILIMILLYVMLSQSLTLTAGYSGLISLAHAGFYGIGAYTSAILSVNNAICTSLEPVSFSFLPYFVTISCFLAESKAIIAS